MYASRFRTEAAHAAIKLVILEQHWPFPAIISPSHDASVVRWAADGGQAVAIGSTALQWTVTEPHSRVTSSAAQNASELSAAVQEATAAAHEEVKAITLQTEFYSSHGLYMVDFNWLFHWQQQLQMQQITGLKQVGWVGLYLYCSRFRHRAARAAVAAAFINRFDLPESTAATVAADCGDMNCSGAHKLLLQHLPGFHPEPVNPAKPFVPTARVLRCWQLAGRSLMLGEPLLIVGRDGCRKSESLKALAWLLGEHIQQFSLTPGKRWHKKVETDAAAFTCLKLPQQGRLPRSGVYHYSTCFMTLPMHSLLTSSCESESAQEPCTVVMLSKTDCHKVMLSHCCRLTYRGCVSCTILQKPNQQPL